MSEENIIVSDVKTLFSQIKDEATTFKFSTGNVKLPDGGHLQGIQKTYSRDYILSGSSNEKAYFLIVDGSSLEACSVQDISISGLKHAGGFQMIGDYCVVGLENDKKGPSLIALFLYDSNKNISHKRNVALKYGVDDGSGTAGAVGIVNYEHGFMLLVGSWDCNKVDIYCASGSIESSDCRFYLQGTWDKSKADRNNWIDKNWGKYQSINMVKQNNGDIYFFAFNRSGVGKDYLDLYQLDLDSIKDQKLETAFKKVSNRHMICKKGASFRYSGGINIQSNYLSVLASERDLHDYTTINSF